MSKLIALGLAALMTVSGISAAFAQGAKNIVGTWMPASIVNEVDGKRLEPFGSPPKGRFIFDGSQFSIIILRGDLPKMASNNRLTGTADEYKGIVHGSLTLFGTYAANDDGSMSWKIESSSFPNWAGTEQKRAFKFSGDNLVITNPGASAGGSATITLQRVK